MGRLGLKEEPKYVGKELYASRELKGCDSRVPVKSSARLQVFGGVPEGAVVGWVEAHATVISPTVGTL